MRRRLRRLLQSDRGATAVEYALIISMIVLAMVAALTQVAGTTTDMWNMIAETARGA